MENFRALMMRMTMNFTPNKSLSPAQKIFVQKKLQEFFPDSRPPPDHPPYSWMIQQAIENMNKEGGSSKEEISQYIVREFSSLPWAHASLLSHHLGKLCRDKEIFETTDGCYALGDPDNYICHTSSPNECDSSKGRSGKKKKMSKSKNKGSKMKERKELTSDVGGEKMLLDAGNEVTKKQDSLLDDRVDVQPQGANDIALEELKEREKQDFASKECYEDEERLESEQVHALKGKRRKMAGKKETNLETDVQLLELEDTSEKEQMQQNLITEEGNEEQQPNSEQGQQKGRNLRRPRKRERIKKNVHEDAKLESGGQPLEYSAREVPNEQSHQDCLGEKFLGEQLNAEQTLEKGKTRSGRLPKRNRKYSVDIKEQTDTLEKGRKQLDRLPKRNRKNNVVIEDQPHPIVHALPTVSRDFFLEEAIKQMRQKILRERGHQNTDVLEKGKRRSSMPPESIRKDNVVLEDSALEDPNEQTQQDFLSECSKDQEQQLNAEHGLESGKRKCGKRHKNVIEGPNNSDTKFQHPGQDDAQNSNGQIQQVAPSKECSEAGKQQQNSERQQVKGKRRLKAKAASSSPSRSKTKPSEGSMKPTDLVPSSNQRNLRVRKPTDLVPSSNQRNLRVRKPTDLVPSSNQRNLRVRNRKQMKH